MQYDEQPNEKQHELFNGQLPDPVRKPSTCSPESTSPIDPDWIPFTVARSQANAHTNRTGEPAIVHHDPDGPGFDWCTEADYHQRRIEIWPDDVVYHTITGPC